VAKYEWLAGSSAPKDRPVFLLAAHFELADGTIEGIPDGRLVKSGWGRRGATQIIGPDRKALPARLYIRWFDLLEKQGYLGLVDVPTAQINTLMDSGLEMPDGKVPVDVLVAGAAPGGDIGLWVRARRVHHLLAMFKAHPVETLVSDMASDPSMSLDGFVEMLLRAGYPTGLQTNGRDPSSENGLWAQHAQRFSLTPLVTGEFEGDLLWMEFANGEVDWFDISGEREVRSSVVADGLALPTSAEFTWSGPTGAKFAGQVKFDISELRDALLKLQSESDGTPIILEFEPAEGTQSVDVYLRAGELFYRTTKTKSRILSVK
jgi:Protein of unknown function (DUF2931)